MGVASRLHIQGPCVRLRKADFKQIPYRAEVTRNDLVLKYKERRLVGVDLFNAIFGHFEDTIPEEKVLRCFGEGVEVGVNVVEVLQTLRANLL